MDHTITIQNSEVIVDKFELIWTLLTLGFTAAMIFVVIAAAIRIGWKFAGQIFLIAFIAWMLY